MDFDAKSSRESVTSSQELATKKISQQCQVLLLECLFALVINKDKVIS